MSTSPPDSPAASPTRRTPGGEHLLIRADASVAMGVGHAMRCLALAQEVTGQGGRVTLIGNLDIEWVAQAYRDAGIPCHPAPPSAADLVDLAHTLRADVALLDGYELPADLGECLRAAGIRVGAMVDGEFGTHQVADIYIDQNPGSPARDVTPPTRALAGADFTLFRDDVLAARRSRLNAHADHASPADPPQAPARPRVLAVFGGTDPMGAAPVVVPLLAEAATRTGRALDLTIVTKDATLAPTIQDALPRGSRVTSRPALSDLATAVTDMDLVVTASGSTVWELLCITVPTAVVCVIDNQTPGYDYATAEDLVAGIGHLEPLRINASAQEAAVVSLVEALTDEPARRRRVRRGRELLDGLGRARVAHALLG